MENCFRFLINVDQCLNMSIFDIFFYRLESQHKFRLNQVQLFGDDFGTSLRCAVSDIRMYLDKYPYYVGDFQIAVAMRGKFIREPERWKDTMLYRLLQLSFELQKARIFITSQEQVEKVLTLIMLYDADFSVELPQLDREPYLAGARFAADCQLLAREIGLSESVGNMEQLAGVLEAYAQQEDCDEACVDLLRRFLARYQDRDELETDEQGFLLPDELEEQELGLLPELITFVREQLYNFQVCEKLIDRNDRRQNILALLRVVDYLNRSTETDPRVDAASTVTTLAERCEANWQQVWSDKELEKRYAAMLRRYRFTLNHAALELERPHADTVSARELPKEEIPSDTEIHASSSVFTETDPEKQGMDLRKILTGFIDNRLSARTLPENWKSVYQRLKRALDEMEHELKVFAEDLSRQYGAALRRRKQESLTWKNSVYMANAETERELSRLEYQRELRLKELKSPQMTPSLKFQDQVNMENALEQGDKQIRFYIRCISAATAVNFLVLLAVLAVGVIVHYTFLQPYVFQSAETALFYLGYAAASVLLMFCTWMLPRSHFKKKIRACVKSLQRDMDLYIKGYFKKAEQFSTYINLLNQLDYLTRYQRLTERAYQTTQGLFQGYLWHKIQVRNHLNKLQFFQGLIDLCDDRDEASQGITALPTVNDGSVCDVVDSPIYWPQGQGGV